MAVGAEIDGIFGRQLARLVEEWDSAESVQPGALDDRLDAAVEQRDIAAELIDDEALAPVSLVRIQQLPGSDDAGDDPAAVDIAEQDHRHIGGQGEAHIGDVGFA